MKYKIKVHHSRDNQFYFTLNSSANGKVLMTSETYSRKQNALKTARRLARELPASICDTDEKRLSKLPSILLLMDDINSLKEKNDELVAADMTHEYNQAEAERTWPQFEEQIKEPLKQEKEELNKKYLKACVARIESEAEHIEEKRELRQMVDKCKTEKQLLLTGLEILRELCNLKHYKDTVGKDSVYESRQPKAWREANEYLNSIGTQIH